jgi:hypothetical protein
MDTLNEHQPERLVVQCILSGATEPVRFTISYFNKILGFHDLHLLV